MIAVSHAVGGSSGVGEVLVRQAEEQVGLARVRMRVA
jgi:hypothetical protein